MNFNHISSGANVDVEREQRSRANLLVNTDRYLATSGTVHHAEEVSDNEVELTSRLEVDAEEGSNLHQKGYSRVAIQRSIVADRHKYKETEPIVVIVEYDTRDEGTTSYVFTVGLDGGINFEIPVDDSHPDFDKDTTKLSTDATDDDVINVGLLFGALETDLYRERHDTGS